MLAATSLYAPLVIILYLMAHWGFKRAKVRRRRNNFKLIQGGKQKRGPYGKSR